jgi:hypothetical protein
MRNEFLPYQTRIEYLPSLDEANQITLRRENFPLREYPKSPLKFLPSRSSRRGVSRIVTTRDGVAVDAEVKETMLTEAYGEVVWS